MKGNNHENAYITWFVCSGCASNPNAGGEVVSGILMGIGQGLSGL